MPVDAVYISQTLEGIARFPCYYLALIDERYVSDIMGITATRRIGSRTISIRFTYYYQQATCGPDT
jgi:hypothetical protein